MEIKRLRHWKFCTHIHFIFIVTSITLLQNVLNALSTQLLLYPHKPFHISQTCHVQGGTILI